MHRKICQSANLPICQSANSYRSAFTLVEISIVLVIIGLLVGGILAGRTLIQQAEIRAAVSQLQKFESAYRTFEVKYGCIMGDCPNATDFFGMNYVVWGAGCPPSGGAGNGNGNGDGFIDNGGYHNGNVNLFKQLGLLLYPTFYLLQQLHHVLQEAKFLKA